MSTLSCIPLSDSVLALWLLSRGELTQCAREIVSMQIIQTVEWRVSPYMHDYRIFARGHQLPACLVIVLYHMRPDLRPIVVAIYCISVLVKPCSQVLSCFPSIVCMEIQAVDLADHCRSLHFIQWSFWFYQLGRQLICWFVGNNCATQSGWLSCRFPDRVDTRD